MEVRRKRKTQVQTIDLDEVENKDEVPWKSCRSMENRRRLPSSIYIQICMALKAAAYLKPNCYFYVLNCRNNFHSSS